MNSSSAMWQHQDVAIWIIVAAVALLVALSVWRGKGSSNGTEDSPETILKRRYATGEIDEPTYQRMLEVIRR